LRLPVGSGCQGDILSELQDGSGVHDGDRIQGKRAEDEGAGGVRLFIGARPALQQGGSPGRSSRLVLCRPAPHYIEQINGNATNQEAIRAVLPDSKDDAKSLKRDRQ
jgi:hypothetical protein